MEKKRILFIDDEQDFLDGVQALFTDDDIWEIKTESDSMLAITRAIQFDPNIIFCDVSMPGMEGGEVLVLFNENEKLNHIPVVFLTGLIGKDEEKHIKGRPYLSKPITKGKILEVAKRYIGDA